MANQEHFRVLGLGTEHWNAWRIANPSIHPNLDEIFLEDKDLSGLDLSYTSLHGATFRNIKFGNCNLSEAD
jgi:uncharacterized protein YjbI with pentapeptide repeats